MNHRQTLRFRAQSETLVEQCLRTLELFADLDEERESFLFTSKVGRPAFRLQCVIVRGGIDVEPSGDCTEFLGLLVQVLAREFGVIATDTGSAEA